MSQNRDNDNYEHKMLLYLREQTFFFRERVAVPSQCLKLMVPQSPGVIKIGAGPVKFAPWASKIIIGLIKKKSENFRFKHCPPQ